MTDFTNYIPVLAALVAGPVAVWITARISKPKVQADATRTLTEISLSLVEPQMKRIEVLEKRQAEQVNKIAGLERWAHRLATQVLEAGLTPVTFDEFRRHEERTL